MQETICQLLHRPESDALRFLPEGPYPYGDHSLSWVAIQHAADSQLGSLNILDLETGRNRQYTLPGRPGFAFPCDREGVFVVGLERQVQLLDLQTLQLTPLTGVVDSGVEGTVINDAVAFGGGLIFGCKDLEFSERKAGLYLWRGSDGVLTQLRDDQICSNGKVVRSRGDGYSLLDIDSPTKTVVQYDLDVDQARLSEPRVVLDLRDDPAFPDGMVATPDGLSVIIAFYHPGDTDAGEARQYRLADGSLEAVWRVPQSPQVTCPQLIRFGDAIRLVLTTAVEHMTAERRASYPDAGCLFVGETHFDALPDTPVFRLSEWQA